MKTKKTIVCGFLAVMFVAAFGDCPATVQGQRLTGTDSFTFTLIKGGTEYRVSKGTATVGAVNIPAHYRFDSKSDYFPVTEIGIGAFSGLKTLPV